jgi:hypothetical protein
MAQNMSANNDNENPCSINNVFSSIVGTKNYINYRLESFAKVNSERERDEIDFSS